MSRLTNRLELVLRRALSTANDIARWRHLRDQAVARLRALRSALPVRWSSLRDESVTRLGAVQPAQSTHASSLLSQVLMRLRAARPEPASRNIVSREPLLPPAAVNVNERQLYETVEQALRVNGYLR